MNPPAPGHAPKGFPQREETPISKYLANLEKRKSIFHPRTSPKIRPGVEGVTQRLNFNDDTFYGGNADQSLLQSPAEPLRLLASSSTSVFKRRRTSLFPQENEDEDPDTYRTRISDLEKLLRQTQVELIDCRTSCTKLEQAGNSTKRSYSEKLILFEQSEAESKAKLKEADDRVVLLGAKLTQSANRESELSASLRQQREAYNTKFAALEEQLTVLKKHNFDLKQKLHESEIESENALKKLQSEYNVTEQGAEKWIIDSQIYQDQLRLTQSQLEKCQAELKIAQMNAIKFQETAMRSENATASSNKEIDALEERVRKFENLYVKEQSNNYALTKTLEKTNAENVILRSTIRSEMLLHEEITSLENQIAFLRQEVNEKGRIEAERDNIRSELETLKEIIYKLDYNCNTPLAFEASLRQSQALLMELKHENSSLKLELDNAMRNSTKLVNEIAGLNGELCRLKEENYKLSADGKKLSKRMFLLVKDRDGLKDLKESYEQEFEGQISEPLKARILNLEEVISEYEVMLNDEKKTCPDCEAKNTLVENLRSELETAHRENETLSQTMSCMQEDGTVGFKIVSLANNPSMISVETRLQECLKENQELKEKLRNYEDNEDETLTLRGSGSNQEKKKLEEDLRTLERKHEILTEAYNYETVQLQQACTKLFGFYVTLIREPQPQIRLQSVNSTCPDDVFIFQEAENDMMLLETPVLEHFRDDIDRFLMRDGSIPSFLASVTITYLQDGERLNQSSSSTQSQVPVSLPTASTARTNNQPPQQPSKAASQSTGTMETFMRRPTHSDSSSEEDEDQDEDNVEEEEDDDRDHDDQDDDDDNEDDAEEDDDESDEPEDVIMIDSD